MKEIGDSRLRREHSVERLEIGNTRRILLLPHLLIVLSVGLLAFGSILKAQNQDADIKASIEQIDKGNAEEVKKLLPDLAAKSPNNPGVLYLQGRLANDGLEAAKFYQSVVDNFPKSEWADDALYRIYQYYYSLGLYKTAELKLEQLKKDYPSSQYVTGKPEVALPKEEEPPVKLPTRDTVQAIADTQHTAAPIAATPTVAPKETPVPATAAPPPTTPSAMAYVLQVGAFSSSVNAQKRKNFFEDLGYNVEVTNKVRSGRSLFLVWIGNFHSKEEARLEGRRIKTKYKTDSIIVEKY